MFPVFLKNLIPGSIERDLLGRHVGPFVFSFVTIMFLLLMQFLIQYLDNLVGQGIPLAVIVELLLVNLAYMVVLAVPMTILASTLMAYGKFSEQNEYTALRAAGVHPMRIIRPVLMVSVLLTLFLGWFSNEVLPEANYKARALFLDIRMNRPGFDLKENTFYEGIEGYTFLVREMPAHTDSLYDITLFQNPDQGRDRAVIKARKGFLESNERYMNLSLHLHDGTIMRHLPQSGSTGTRYEETSFDSYRITFDLSELTFSRTNPQERSRDGRSMSAQAMLAVVDTLQSEMRREVRNFRQNLKASHITLSPDSADFVPMSSFNDAMAMEDPSYRRQNYGPEYMGKIDDSHWMPHPDSLRYVSLRELDTFNEVLNATQLALSEIQHTRSMSEQVSNALKWRTERTARFMVEVHKKASIPVACILFALIGAPLGLLVRNGNMGVHVLISTVLFTYYWISIIQGEKLADRMFISPFAGMWFSNFTMALAAAVLLYTVTKRR